MNYSLVFCLLVCCFTANAQEPTAQECIDRALVTLTEKNQKYVVYSELLKSSSEPGDVKTSSLEFVKIASEYKQAPQELLLLKENVEGINGILSISPVVVTMLLRQLGETKCAEFIGGGAKSSMLGLVPDKQENEAPTMQHFRAGLDFLVVDARQALLLPLYFQRVNQVAVPLIVKHFDELVDERQTAKETVGVWQFGVSKVEVGFSKANSWLPTRLRWYESKANRALARSNTGEIAEKPTYENEVIWQMVEDVWIPVYVRYATTPRAAGRGRSCEYVQHSMYRFKSVEKFGPVDGFFEELGSGGPFQKLILEMTDDLTKFQNAKK